MSRAYNEVSEEDWKRVPLCTILYEWLYKNISVPSDMTMLLTYICLFLMVCYSLVWISRFVMSVIWPFLFILLAVVAYRLLMFYEEIEDIKSISLVTKALEFFLKAD